MPGTFPTTLHRLTPLILPAAECGRDYGAHVGQSEESDETLCVILTFILQLRHLGRRDGSVTSFSALCQEEEGQGERGGLAQDEGTRSVHETTVS